MILTGGQQALVDSCAALAFSRYVNTRQWKYPIWPGAFTNLNSLKNGNGALKNALSDGTNE